MAKKIFVNLPVKDLKRSIDFFSSLGFSFNPQFTDEQATCMIIGENIYAMLLVENRFKDFTNKKISDAKQVPKYLLHLMRRAGRPWMIWCKKRQKQEALYTGIPKTMDGCMAIVLPTLMVTSGRYCIWMKKPFHKFIKHSS